MGSFGQVCWGGALWVLSKSAGQMLVRPRGSLRIWDFEVKSRDVFWALFQTDNPNTVGYSHQWCTMVLVYMQLGLPKWFAGLGLCSAGLIFNRNFESCYKLNLGAPLFSSWIFSQKKIGQMFYMLRLIRSCSNGAGSASKVMCKNIIFILLWTHFEDCWTSVLNVKIVMSVFGNFNGTFPTCQKG